MIEDDEYTPGPDPDEAAVLASERVVLGAAIQSAKAAEEIALTLKPEHFRSGSHQTVFAAVLSLAGTGDPVDPASVLSELVRSGMAAKVGAPDAGTGGVFLATLTECTGAPVEALRDGLDAGTAWHVQRVRKGWQKRSLVAALRQSLGLAAGPAFDPDEHAAGIRKLIDEATTGPSADALPSQAEVIPDVLERLESEPNPGLPTGMRDLDAVIGGLRPGEMIVVGGRPSMGKSVLALEFAEHVSGELGLPVLLSSLEMSSDEVSHRRIARHARVSLEKVTRHELTDDDWARINASFDRLTGSPLKVDAKAGVSQAHIRARLREMERAGEAAQLLVVDYLGLMDKPNLDSHQVSVAALSAGFKQIARDFDIPVVLVVQLSRLPELRTDKRPVMSDLRDSGQIEADADLVLLVYREDYYEADSPRAGEVDVIVAKQRQGQRTTVPLSFMGHYSRIADLSHTWTASSVIGETA
jgi:replicative DNA helicase